METIIVILVTLVFGLILFNLINNKKISIFSFLLLIIIGLFYFLKFINHEYYEILLLKFNNINLYVVIFSFFTFLVSVFEYCYGGRKKDLISADNSVEKKETIKSVKNVEDLDNLMVYLEMMDEPLAFLIDNSFLINNKMKKKLKCDKYSIDKKKFINYVYSADKGIFSSFDGSKNFRLNIDGEHEWYESICVNIKERMYCLIKKASSHIENKIMLNTFKDLTNKLNVYESENKDYYLIIFDINNIKDIMTFYGKDFCNLAISKHLSEISNLSYISDMNIFYITQSQYIILLDSLMEYNILLSELENNTSIMLKDDIMISDNKICIKGKIGAVASMNIKDCRASNVINKGFEMLKLACEEDFQGDFAIYHEVDEEVDYSLRDLNIDLDLDLSQYNKRIR